MVNYKSVEYLITITPLFSAALIKSRRRGRRSLINDQCKRKKLWSTDSSKKRSRSPGPEQSSRKTRRSVYTLLQSDNQLRFFKLRQDRRWHVGAFLDESDYWINDTFVMVPRPAILPSTSLNLDDFKTLLPNLTNRGPIRANLNQKFNEFVRRTRLNFENDFLRNQLEY